MWKKIIRYFLFWFCYMAAAISLILPIDAIDRNQPFFNHPFLLGWATIAMVVSGFISSRTMKRLSKIFGDAIVAGVVVFSGLALFLVVLGDFYRETLEASPFRVSDWKVLVFLLESGLLAAGSMIVIWRTNDWSTDEIDAASDTDNKDNSSDIQDS